MLEFIKSLFRGQPHWYVYQEDSKWFAISSIDYTMLVARNKEAILRQTNAINSTMAIKY